MADVQNYLKRHEKGEIMITGFLSSQNLYLIDGITFDGTLTLDVNRILTYVFPDGKTTKTIVDYRIIDIVEYETLTTTNNNGNNSGNGSGNGSNDENNDDSGTGNNSKYPSDDILNVPSVIDSELGCPGDLIYPKVLSDGRLVYPASYGRIQSLSNSGGGYVTKENFDQYSGSCGYVSLLQMGVLKMKLVLPERGKYKISFRTSSKDNSAKRVSVYLNGSEYIVRSNSGKKNLWSEVSMGIFEKPKDNAVKEFDFDRKIFEVTFTMVNNVTKDILIDAIVLEKIPEPVLIRDPYPIIEPEVIEDVIAYEISKGFITNSDGKKDGKLIDVERTATSTTVGRYAVSLMDSQLRSAFRVPKTDKYIVGLLIKNVDKENSSNKLSITINDVDYIGRIATEQSDKLFSYVRLYKDRGGFLRECKYIKLYKGENKINIKSVSNNEKFLGLINSLLISLNIDDYYEVSNDFDRLLLPNWNDIYFINDLDDFNEVINSNEKFGRTAINLRENYDDIEELDFEYGTRNINLMDYAHNDNVSSTLTFKPDKNGNDIYRKDIVTETKPKVAMVVRGCDCPCRPVPRAELGTAENQLTRIMNVEFLLYHYRDTIHYSYDRRDTTVYKHDTALQRWRETFYAADRYLELEDFDNNLSYTIDLGYNWKIKLLKEIKGLTMSEKISLFNILINS